jgi:hypothetical protein
MDFDFDLPSPKTKTTKELLQQDLDEAIGSEHLQAVYLEDDPRPYQARERYGVVHRVFTAETKDELLYVITNYFQATLKASENYLSSEKITIETSAREVGISIGNQYQAKMHSLIYPERIEVLGLERDSSLGIDLVCFAVLEGRRQSEISALAPYSIIRDYERVS